MQCLVTESTARRFEEKYIPEPMSGCWLWLGAVSKGRATMHAVPYPGSNNAMRWAAQVAFELYKGPRSGHVLHTCDNVLCVNPDHLYCGTNQDNMTDKKKRGRSLPGENHPNCKFSDELVLAVRADTRTEREIATAFDLSFNSVHYLRAKGWEHLR